MKKAHITGVAVASHLLIPKLIVQLKKLPQTITTSAYIKDLDELPSTYPEIPDEMNEVPMHSHPYSP